jgi:hypothetical protein
MSYLLDVNFFTLYKWPFSLNYIEGHEILKRKN